MIKIIKSKPERSIEEIMNDIEGKKISTEKKTLDDFSKNFQPELQRVIKILESSKSESHVSISQRMFELLKKKWENVIQSLPTLQVLTEHEEERFIMLVNEIKVKLNMINRESKYGEFWFVDLNKIGLD